jgi:pimeloyl-ACP methyl ester carboxylesterase
MTLARALVRDGVTFAHLDRGAGGVPFVFQHGLGGDAAQPDGLYPAERRLVCLECRGHGATEPLGLVEDLGFAPFADDVMALIGLLGLNRPLVGGVSMGAGVAGRIAALHPERVRGLVLVRPAWVDDVSPANLAVNALAGRLLDERGAEDGLAAMLEDPRYAAVLAESASAARSVRGQFTRGGARERAAVLRRMVADAPLADGAARWEDVAVPTLVIATHGDPVHPWAMGAALAARIPDARLVEVPSKDADAAAHAREISAALAAFADILSEENDD